MDKKGNSERERRETTRLGGEREREREEEMGRGGRKHDHVLGEDKLFLAANGACFSTRVCAPVEAFFSAGPRTWKNGERRCVVVTMG